MNIGAAIVGMKKNQTWRRAAWSRDQVVWIQQPLHPISDEIIVMAIDKGDRLKVVPYIGTSSDILANDWEEYHA